MKDTEFYKNTSKNLDSKIGNDKQVEHLVKQIFSLKEGEEIENPPAEIKRQLFYRLANKNDLQEIFIKGIRHTKQADLQYIIYKAEETYLLAYVRDVEKRGAQAEGLPEYMSRQDVAQTLPNIWVEALMTNINAAPVRTKLSIWQSLPESFKSYETLTSTHLGVGDKKIDTLVKFGKWDWLNENVLNKLTQEDVGRHNQIGDGILSYKEIKDLPKRFHNRKTEIAKLFANYRGSLNFNSDEITFLEMKPEKAKNVSLDEGLQYLHRLEEITNRKDFFLSGIAMQKNVASQIKELHRNVLKYKKDLESKMKIKLEKVIEI